ncbi:MAG TPA: hypothetical protein VHZ29_18620 [Rhizomicrobium sp.]|jgi:Tol biopolymer transport system component|nr:hypothetical protein [Rhizomicrobium sp.]
MPDDSAAPPDTPPADQPGLFLRLGAPALVTVVLIVAGWAAWTWAAMPHWEIGDFRVAIASPLFENDPAIAPNGLHIAYAAGPAPNASHIFVRKLTGGQSIQLTDGPDNDDMRPTWAPLGDRIAFIRHREGQPCTIMIKSVAAAADLRVVGHCREDDFSGLAWAPQGDALYFADRPRPHAARRIMRLDLANGSVAEVTHPPDASVGDREPDISPDGAKIAFVRRANGATTAMLRDLKSGAETPLPAATAMNAQKAWIDNDTLITGTGGQMQPALWIVPLHGTPQRLSVNSQALGSISAGPNGTFAVETFRAQTVLASPPTGDAQKPEIFAATNGISFLPQYSVDGRLAYVHIAPGGLTEVWTQKPGEMPRQVSAIGARLVAGIHWSPDGRRLAFYATIGNSHGFYVINADGTDLHAFGQNATVGLPEWTPDGQGLILSMKDAKGWRIWKMRLDRPDRFEPVSPYGWFVAHPGRGGALYAMGTNAEGIWRIDGKPVFVAHYRRRCTENLIECQTWAVSGDTLLFGDHAQRARPRIVLHALTDGSERTVPAPGMDNNDEITMDPVTGKILYTYDGLGDADIALFHLTRH